MARPDRYSIKAFGKKTADGFFQVFEVQRGLGGDYDVEIEIEFCGFGKYDSQVCNNYYGNTRYPIVPGREITGTVRFVGKNVKDFKIGDQVGVGAVVDSCMECDQCEEGQDQACEGGFTMAFNDKICHGHISTDAEGYTYGGFSQRILINHRFVVKIPEKLSLSAAATFLTTGTLVYAPLKKLGANHGDMHVLVIGLGELGMMAIRIATKMENVVTAMAEDQEKEDLAVDLGASRLLSLQMAPSMDATRGKFHIIMDCLTVDHEVSAFLPMLQHGGTLVMAGSVKNPPSEILQHGLRARNLSVSGYSCTGTANTQEAMRFCSRKNMMEEPTIIAADQLDDVFEELSKNDEVSKNYVLNVKNSIQRLPPPQE